MKEPGSDDTVLNCAVQVHQVDGLKKLLENTGLSPNDVNCNGRTPLYFAAYYNDIPTINLLVEYHANLDLEDRYTYTPLYIAHKEKNFAAAIALIDAGAKIDTTKVNVQNIFFAAVEFGRVKGVEILLREGADVLCRNGEGQTALQIAGAARDAEMIQILELGEGKVEKRVRPKISMLIRDAKAKDDE